MWTLIRNSLKIVALTTFFGAVSLAQAATILHKYDFTSGVTDLVGTENGTLEGSANLQNGRLNLDGRTGFVQFGSTLIPMIGSYSIAIAAMQGAAQSRFIELISQGQSGGQGIYIGTNPSGQIRAGDFWPVTGVSLAPVGVWADYALVVDDVLNRSDLYKNGMLVASLASAISSGPGTNTRLGRQFDPFSEFFNGSIDNVSIYAGALTASEVSALATTHVPEPSAFSLMALGILVLSLVSYSRARRFETGVPASIP